MSPLVPDSLSVLVSPLVSGLLSVQDSLSVLDSLSMSLLPLAFPSVLHLPPNPLQALWPAVLRLPSGSWPVVLLSPSVSGSAALL